MKREMRLVAIILVACLMIGCTAQAESALSKSGLSTSGGALVSGAEMRATVEALQRQIDAGLPINGIDGVQMGSSSRQAGPALTSISLDPMPSILNSASACIAKHFPNNASCNHPILVKPTPANAEYRITSVVLELPGGGDASEFAIHQYDVMYNRECVYCKKAGRVKLTITTDNGKKASKILTITDNLIPIRSLSLYTTSSAFSADYAQTSVKTLLFYKNSAPEAFRIAASASPTSASYGAFHTFFVAAAPAVQISSSDDDVAAVDLSSGPNGYVYPKKPGVAYITCRATDGGRARASMKLILKGAPVTGIAMSDFGLQIGATRKIVPTITPGNAWDQSITWSSGNKRVATVDSKGNVKGIAAGVARITAKNRASGVSGSAMVTVGYGKLATGSKYYHYGFFNATPPASRSSLCVALALVNGSEYAEISGGSITKSSLTYTLGKIPGRGMTEKDVTTVYFAFQGKWSLDASERGAIVCPADNQLLKVSELQEILEMIPGTVVLILDCDLSGQYITGRSASPAAKLAQARGFNQAWIDALSSSKATNFTSKALPGSAHTGKFKILAACGALESLQGDPAWGFSWMGYWLGMGLGMTPNRASGDAGTFSIDNLRANRVAPSVPVVTLSEAYSYVKANMEKEFMPLRRQSVSAWPANDQTAILNLVP